MESAPTLEMVLERLGDQMRNADPPVRARMLGLMFCRPQLRLAKEELLPNLNYFDRRSAEHIDFFFVGFLPPLWVDFYGDSEFAYPVQGPNGQNWLFDESQFNEWRKTIEEHSSWRYSGANDLLLVNARRDESGFEAKIDLTSALSVTLESIKSSESLPEISMLFEKIFQYSETPDSSDPVAGFSDKMGLAIGREAMWSVFTSIVPEPLRSAARSAFAYAVRDYTAEH